MLYSSRNIYITLWRVQHKAFTNANGKNGQSQYYYRFCPTRSRSRINTNILLQTKNVINRAQIK